LAVVKLAEDAQKEASMADTRYPIAQVEFLHLRVGEDATLGSLFVEAAARALEHMPDALAGSRERLGTKTVVRFYDERGELAELARRYRELSLRERIVMQTFPVATGVRRWRLNRESKRNAGESLSIRAQVASKGRRDLADALKRGRPVGIELADNTFRPVEKDEVHELLERAARAKGAQLFVFRPAELLATERLTSLGAIM
jgi:hypothetical protein